MSLTKRQTLRSRLFSKHFQWKTDSYSHQKVKVFFLKGKKPTLFLSLTHTLGLIKHSRNNSYSSHNEKYARNVCDGMDVGGNYKVGIVKPDLLGYLVLTGGNQRVSSLPIVRFQT